MNCDHLRGDWEQTLYEDGDSYCEWVERYATVDLDAHRYKCTLCNKVMYYSSAAKNYYEHGIKSEVDGLNK